MSQCRLSLDYIPFLFSLVKSPTTTTLLNDLTSEFMFPRRYSLTVAGSVTWTGGDNSRLKVEKMKTMFQLRKSNSNTCN